MEKRCDQETGRRIRIREVSILSVGKGKQFSPHTDGSSDHPEKKLTLLLTSTGVLFGFIGSTIGTFSLAHLSGVPTDFSIGLFPSHPFLQIYGFISEFVIGVSYSLLPRFKIRSTQRIELGYLTYGLFTLSNIFLLFAPLLSSYSHALDLYASFFLLVGSFAFTYHVFPLAFHPGGGFPEVDPLIILSPISLILISLANFLEFSNIVTQNGSFPEALILLALLGFAGSMIYLVEIRSVSFRQCNYRKNFARFSWMLQAAAIGSTCLSLLLPIPELSLVGALLFLAAALDVILTIRIFEFVHPIMYKPAMTRMHFAIVRYNELCLASGSAWLLLGTTLAMISLTLGNTSTYSFFLRDSFIHSLAIGFIGSTITCFAPMLLPSLLGKKAPVTGLSFWPILFLNAGMIIRVAGNILTTNSSAPPIWESLSGPLIIAAMVSLVVMLPRVGKKTVGKRQDKSIVSIQNSIFGRIKNEREASLVFKTRTMNREISVSLWFVEKEGALYFLPLKGVSSNWYNSLLINPKAALIVRGQTFSVNSQSITRSNEVRKIIKLFKDKYSDREYKNLFPKDPDCAVMLLLDGAQ